jgi:hypothetical protein
VLRTPRNIFGLFRQYRAERLPSHDPEEFVGFQDLQDAPVSTDRPLQNLDNIIYPYPNENSFRLGEWYWNHGIQKSHESFTELLSIVGGSKFRPEDVQHKQWNKIDKKLAGDGGDEWLDVEDAGWKTTPIHISVPFPRRAKNPGPKDYLVGNLHHRTLVSIIREKLTRTDDVQQFHFEPFELFWKPAEDSPDVKVHGELYTSKAFLDAHHKLQNSPGEPGCDLPRVVVALMMWSDATHLTAFGSAKLWPSYLYFGNESKYRRCKPTCHLCEHVAYFQTVSTVPIINFILKAHRIG